MNDIIFTEYEIVNLHHMRNIQKVRGGGVRIFFMDGTFTDINNITLKDIEKQIKKVQEHANS